MAEKLENSDEASTGGLNRDLVGILFPGIVKNDDKAIKCLGGVRNISQVYSNSTKKRLGLSYQPDNPFIRKIYGNTKRTAGVLLKVKVKKVRVKDEIKREVISTDVVGRVRTMIKFEAASDFQYMPVQSEGAGDGPKKCVLENILPSGVDTYESMLEPAPLILLPSQFTRFERPISYSYTDKKYPERSSPDRGVDSVHNKLRSLRGTQVSPYIFSLTDDLPTEPHETYLKQKYIKLETNPHFADEFETVKKMLEERPIWSLNLIRYQTKFRLSSLKIIMPCLAVYLKTGPWRAMWVRFGYDPRKEPGARIYQTLDFRLRHAAGVRSMIMSRVEETSERERRELKRKHTEPPANEEIAEGSVYFRPGMAPTQRHIFYQYCDIQLPEVEEILAAEPPPGYLCHPKRGWLPPNTDEICRDHMFRYVKDTLFSTSSFLKLEQVSEDESNSDLDDEASANDVDET